MVIKLSNHGASKKFFESKKSDDLLLYKNAKLILTVHHILENKDIYDAIDVTPFDFYKRLGNNEEFKKYSNLAKFLFLLPNEMPFTLVIVEIKNGEEIVEKNQKHLYGHKILFIFHGLTHVNSLMIKQQLLKKINKKQKAKWLPTNCIQSNKKLLNLQCQMLVDYEKCFTGNLKIFMKMIKKINKTQEPIKLFINDTVTVPSHFETKGVSDENIDNAIKIITLSLNIYETIEFKFLGGEMLAKNDCKNQLSYYKANFQSFISDLKTVLQMIISEYANFKPASNIAKFLPGLYQSCFYLFTNLLENISLITKIEGCSEILAPFFQVNKIILELIWYSKQWFYLYNSTSKVAGRALLDYDPSKFTILVNSETIDEIDFLYNENNSNLIWIFDPNSMNDCEAKIISNHKKFLLAVTAADNGALQFQTKQANATHISSAILTYEILKNDNKPRFLLCSKCKCLFQTIHQNPFTVKCQCGISLFQTIERCDILNAKNCYSTTEIDNKLATVTMDVSIELTSHMGEIFVDVINKPRIFTKINKTIALP